jgi:hypothetical protein
MFTPKEEATVIMYMAAFRECTMKDQCMKTMRSIIEKKGDVFTGTLYRGQPFENPKILAKFPFFSTSYDISTAISFSEHSSKPGHVFILHLKKVRVLDLSTFVFTNTSAVKAECLKYWEGTTNEFWDSSFFTRWWKRKDWLKYQKGEKEVLVLNQLHFKKAEKGENGFTRRNYKTYESWASRKKR